MLNLKRKFNGPKQSPKKKIKIDDPRNDDVDQLANCTSETPNFSLSSIAQNQIATVENVNISTIVDEIESDPHHSHDASASYKIANRKYTTEQTFKENIKLYKEFSELISFIPTNQEDYTILEEQIAQLKFELASVLNKQSRTFHVHPIIDKNDVVVSEGSSVATFISQREKYLIIREIQESKLNRKLQELKGVFPSYVFNGDKYENRVLRLDDGIFVLYGKKNLGFGANGVVSLGMSLDTDTLVAIKFYEQILSEDCFRRNDEEMLSQFNRLIATHNNYSIQKLIWGVDYLTYLDDNTISLVYFLDMTLKFARAINDFHKNGLVHGDIHSKNIIWDPEAKACQFVDFELTHPLTEEKKESDILDFNTEMIDLMESLTEDLNDDEKQLSQELAQLWSNCGIELGSIITLLHKYLIKSQIICQNRSSCKKL